MGTPPRLHIPGKMEILGPCDCAVQAFCDEWILTSKHNREKAGLLTKLKYGCRRGTSILRRADFDVKTA